MKDEGGAWNGCIWTRIGYRSKGLIQATVRDADVFCVSQTCRQVCQNVGSFHEFDDHCHRRQPRL